MALTQSQLRNQRRYKDKRRQEGYCNKCFSRKVDKGLKNCRRCREMNRKNSKKQRARIKRQLLK